MLARHCLVVTKHLRETVPSHNLWHAPGYRYCYQDEALGATRCVGDLGGGEKEGSELLTIAGVWPAAAAAQPVSHIRMCYYRMSVEACCVRCE